MSESSEENRTAEDAPLPGGDFRLFIQKLGYQALISMGIVDNPVTKTRETNLALARGVIDDLMMIRDKSRGNLEDDEEQHLDAVIGDLQKHFVVLSEREQT
jgi:hypothetical protein